MVYKLPSYLVNFKDKNILVVGDVMLDEYTYGDVKRISKEAPIPIVDVSSTEYVFGGASNVAHNILTLSGNPSLYGVIGNDIDGNQFLNLIKNTVHFGKSIRFNGLTYDGRKTTKKTRVVSKKHQILRMDNEDNSKINDEKLVNGLVQLLTDNSFDIIVVSDYNKGMITRPIMSELKKYSNATNTPIIVDVRPQNMRLYKDVFLITPNKDEAGQMARHELKTLDDIEAAGSYLVRSLNANVIITRGEGGMSVFEKDKQPTHLPSVVSLEVSDVSGAGDTVVATISLAIASGASLVEAATLANYSGGIKVGKFGTAPVHINELEKIIEKSNS